MARLTPAERDERWFGEWVAWGIRNIELSLLHHAEFDQYLIDHPSKEEDEPSDPQLRH